MDVAFTKDSQRVSDFSAGIQVAESTSPDAERILTPAALDFVADLVRRFGWRRDELLARRAALQPRWDAGWRPDFPAETAHIRAAEWTVAPLPADLQDRRVEITGPVDRKMVINALNSGAKVFMADFEDANAPTWDNVVSGQGNLFDAVRRTIRHVAPETGKVYELGPNPAVLFVRPRGWHLVEKHVRVDGKPVPASLFDFGLYLFHNAAELRARGSGPYFYLPKLEGHLEARLWNDVFLRAQELLGLPRATIKATVLIETLPAAFEMDEILYELREHSAGLNCGRWDYIFSFIKKQRADAGAVLPDRAVVTMDKGFLKAYVQLLIRTCHRRGVHAMGGMAAQIPIKDDPAANEAALAKVAADKLREVTDGHDGTWVAHPGLVPVAQAIFDRRMPGPNQIANRRADVTVTASDLLAIPEGERTEEGLRHAIRVALRYLESWLRGQGCVPIYSLMEDAATAEICRAQVWQWLHHGTALADGSPVTPARFRRLLDDEVRKIHAELGEAAWQESQFVRARGLFERLATAAEFEEFLTLPAYGLLVGEETGGITVAEPAGPDGANRDAAPYHPDPRRWDGIVRPYTKAEVERLQGTVQIEHTLAQMGARRLWELLHTRPYVHTLGALSGNQAVQFVKAGLEAIYLSGWQVAADANTAGQTYPDQSLYPADSVPTLVRRINRALQRADQIERSEGRTDRNWFAPILADAEAGFGGPLNAFELMKALIEAGAAGVHFEDQLASEKKCGHMGGKVLVPTSQFLRTLIAARLAADVQGVPTVLVARTDAHSGSLILSDVDEYDAPFIIRERTAEGFYRFRNGIPAAVHRALAYAPYADLIWCETSTPDLAEAREFAEGVHARFPGKMLAYNCSPSFNWKKHLDDATIAKFQRELAAMGYRFQFVTLAGYHALLHGSFDLAAEYRDRGMAAYTELQQAEFASEKHGYTATRHQREAATGYFDLVTETLSGGQASTKALTGSTEEAQFTDLDRIFIAQEGIDQEHAHLNAIMGRLKAAKELPALRSALAELDVALRGHFRSEESGDGLHGLVVKRAPAYFPAFDALMKEHAGFLQTLKTLAETAEKGDTAAVVAGVDALAEALKEHEIREDGLAQSALAQGRAQPATHA
jgi:malate synthase A